jgi:hypothetical protein
MKKSLIVFLVLSNNLIFSQALKRNSLSGGLLGNNPFLAINYERKFLLTNNKTGFLTAGLGCDLLFPVSAAVSKLQNNNDFSLLIFFLPHHITYNFGKKNHYFEAGYGGIASPETIILPGIHLGYRYESDNHFQFKAYTNPLITRENGIRYTALLGLSFGRSF